MVTELAPDDEAFSVILARLTAIEQRLVSIERLMIGISYWALRPVGHVDSTGKVHLDEQ
jgi:hypothetical protein